MPQRQILPDIAASMSASRRVWIAGEQRRGGHDLTRLAIAALNDLEIEPRLLDFLSCRRVADRLDGGDRESRRRFVSA